MDLIAVSKSGRASIVAAALEGSSTYSVSLSSLAPEVEASWQDIRSHVCDLTFLFFFQNLHLLAARLHYNLE